MKKKLLSCAEKKLTPGKMRCQGQGEKDYFTVNNLNKNFFT